MNKRQVEKHIKQNDYFGTLATVLDLTRQTLEQNKKSPEQNRQIRLLKKLKEELVFLQKNYKIIKK